MALWSNYASVVVSLSVLDLNSVSLLLTSAWNIKAPANWTAAENSPQYFKTLSPDGGGIILFFNVELTEVTAVHVSDTLSQRHRRGKNTNTSSVSSLFSSPNGEYRNKINTNSCV